MVNTHGEHLGTRTDISCFWCRHPFHSPPVGCPLDYVTQRMLKKENVSEKSYQLRENVSEDVFRTLHSSLLFTTVQATPCFVVDGVFCSFPCCFAFIDDHRHDPLYTQSVSLLRRMYYTLFDVSTSFVKAPSWRLLSAYGGTLSIQDFRKSFSNVQYIASDHIVQKPVRYIYEKQITL
jgi:hypothetical protein